MDVWGTPVIASVEDIIDVLRAELRASGSHLLADKKITGRNIALTCISHKNGAESKPSMGLLTEDIVTDGKVHKAGTANCLRCGYTASLPEFVSNCFGYNDKGMFGYKWITQNFVNLAVEKRKPLKIDMTRGKKQADVIEYVSEEELDRYRVFHPYMYERKLTDKVIEYFDVGYDEEDDSLTFPVHDHKGRVVLIQRRGVSGKRFDNGLDSRKGLYVYGLYQVLLNLEWIKEVYICESPIDALTCWTYRVPAVATMGAKMTNTQIRLLSQLPVRAFVSALDNDEAGDKAHSKLKETLGQTKLLYRLQLPDDCNDVNLMTEEEFHSRRIVLA